MKAYLIVFYTLGMLFSNAGFSSVESFISFEKLWVFYEAELKAHKKEISLLKSLKTDLRDNNYRKCTQRAYKDKNLVTKELKAWFYYGILNCLEKGIPNQSSKSGVKTWLQLILSYLKTPGLDLSQAKHKKLYYALGKVLKRSSAQKYIKGTHPLVLMFVDQSQDQSSIVYTLGRLYLSQSEVCTLIESRFNKVIRDCETSENKQKRISEKSELAQIKKQFSRKDKKSLKKIIQSLKVVKFNKYSFGSKLGWVYKDHSSLRKLIRNHELLKEPDLLWGVTDVLMRQGEFDLVDEVYAAQVKESLDHRNKDQWMRALIYKGDYKRANSKLNRFLIFESVKSNDLVWLNALALLRREKYDKALQSLEILDAEESGYQLSALYWKYKIFDLKERKPEADIVFQKMVDLYPMTYFTLKLKSERSASYDFLEQPAPSFTEEQKQTVLAKEFLVLGASGFGRELYYSQVQQQDEIPLLYFYSKVLSTGGEYLYGILSSSLIWKKSPKYFTQDLLSWAYPTPYLDIINKEAWDIGFEPSQILSLIRQESAFNRYAESSSKARGLMQMIPGTAREVSRSLRIRNFSNPKSLYTPHINVKMGTYYLKRLMRSYKNYFPWTLAAYNSGPGRMKKWSAGRDDVYGYFEDPKADFSRALWFEELPREETRFYVKAILRNNIIYRDFILSNRK